MICRLCGKDKKLVESHIIPKKFYTPLFVEKQSPRIISNKPGFYPKKSPSGIYDKIVCVECERIFSPWDDYAQKVLLTQNSKVEYLKYNDKKIAYIKIYQFQSKK